MSNRWTYHVAEVKPGIMRAAKTEKIQAELNRLGAQGWELVNIAISSPLAPAILVLKRPQ